MREKKEIEEEQEGRGRRGKEKRMEDQEKVVEDERKKEEMVKIKKMKMEMIDENIKILHRERAASRKHGAEREAAESRPGPSLHIADFPLAAPGTGH